jgi:hypothetical protein
MVNMLVLGKGVTRLGRSVVGSWNENRRVCFFMWYSLEVCLYGSSNMPEWISLNFVIWLDVYLILVLVGSHSLITIIMLMIVVVIYMWYNSLEKVSYRL